MSGWALGCLLAAPFVGSVLGVLILRLPAGRPVAWARSACAACGRRLGAAELVPLASHLALRGRCRGCGAPIAALHWQVELAALAVPVWALAAPLGQGPLLAASCAYGWVLLALAWIDLRDGLLPDALTLPLLLAGLGVAWWTGPATLNLHAAGAALGWLGFRVVDLAYRAWRGRAGLGQGDAKLLGAIGAWCGVAALPWVVLAAALAGLAGASVLALRGQAVSRTTSVPFGPALALGGWLAWLYLPG